jgi:RNA-binding protein
MSEHSQLSQSQKKQFRSIGHQLNPIVTVGDKGLNENVVKELERALEDHELIKVKLPAGDRENKKTLITEICDQCACTAVQSVGNVALIYRAAKKPNPKLSNLLKHKNN